MACGKQWIFDTPRNSSRRRNGYDPAGLQGKLTIEKWPPKNSTISLYIRTLYFKCWKVPSGQGWINCQCLFIKSTHSRAWVNAIKCPPFSMISQFSGQVIKWSCLPWILFIIFGFPLKPCQFDIAFDIDTIKSGSDFEYICWILSFDHEEKYCEILTTVLLANGIKTFESMLSSSECTALPIRNILFDPVLWAISKAIIPPKEEPIKVSFRSIGYSVISLFAKSAIDISLL